MSALITTFRPDSLANVGVDIDHCDGEIGAALAMILAELGARIDMRGSDRRKLHDLHASITSHWGDVRVTSGPVEQETLIRIFRSPDEAKAFLFSPAASNRATAILIVPAHHDTDMALAGIARRNETPRTHILALPDDGAFDSGALAAIAGFLLSPATEKLGGQFLHVPQATSNASPDARRPAYPHMPVCAPAIIPLGRSLADGPAAR